MSNQRPDAVPTFRCSHPRTPANTASYRGASSRCLICKRAADLRYLARNLDRERARKRAYARARAAARRTAGKIQ